MVAKVAIDDDVLVVVVAFLSAGARGERAATPDCWPPLIESEANAISPCFRNLISCSAALLVRPVRLLRVTTQSSRPSPPILRR